jgi:hypothetical protein
VILTEDGKHPVKLCTLKFIIPSKWSCNFQRKENLQFSVTFTATVERRIFLCMVVMCRIKLKNPDFSLFFYHQSHRSSYTMIVGSETKRVKNQQLECLYSTILDKTHAYTLWKVPFVVMTRDPMQNITLARTI